PVHAVATGPMPLDLYFERRLAVVPHHRSLARPDLHDHLGAQNGPVPPAESGVEEPRVMRADLAGSGVIDDHLGRELRGDPDALLGEPDRETVGFREVRVARGALGGIPGFAASGSADAADGHRGVLGA